MKKLPPQHPAGSGWEALSIRQVLDTPVFSLFAEESKCLRTGASNTFFYFHCVDWVNVIAETTANKLVMIRQHRHGSRSTHLEIPGGGMEKDEADPIAAGARELLEETGYAGKNGKIIGKVCPNPALQNNTCYTVYFPEVEFTGQPEMESTEDIETLLMPIPEVLEAVRTGGITHGLVLNAIYFYEMMNQQ